MTTSILSFFQAAPTTTIAALRFARAAVKHAPVNAELRYLRDVTLIGLGLIALCIVAVLLAGGTGHFNAVTFAIAYIAIGLICLMAWAMVCLSRFWPADAPGRPRADKAAEKPKARYLPAIISALAIAGLGYGVITEPIKSHNGQLVDRNSLILDSFLIVARRC